MIKPKRYENKTYREYIKSLPCCITGQSDVDPHHVKSVGSGGSDLTMIPLAHELHQECHSIGLKTFQAKYNIDFRDIQIECLQGFIEKEKL